jgi:hypothetical protein
VGNWYGASAGIALKLLALGVANKRHDQLSASYRPPRHRRLQGEPSPSSLLVPSLTVADTSGRARLRISKFKRSCWWHRKLAWC